MKHILSILLSIVSFTALAQKATVESVVFDPINISASKYPMTDLNGHTAPLVIVRVLADDVEFKGSVLDRGVIRKTGEYWVYMGAGAKMLHIHSDKFLPVEIRFPDYDIPRLEAASTYVVTLSLPQAAQQAAVVRQNVEIKFSPADAIVLIDGQFINVTNGVASTTLPADRDYNFTVTGRGYIAQQGTFHLHPGAPTKLNVELATAPAAITAATTQPTVEPSAAAEAPVAQQAANDSVNYTSFKDKTNGKYGFKDESGKVVIPAIYDDVFGFSEGLAAVKTQSKWGFIDRNNKFVIPALYDGAYFSFSEGLAIVAINGKYGAINKNNQLIIPAIYDELYGFSEGLSPVKINGKNGYLDKNNTIIIPAKYDSAQYFHEGLAAIRRKSNSKIGFIDKHDELVIPAIYEYAYGFSEGLAAVKIKGKFGFINHDNNLVIPAVYDHAYNYREGMAQVNLNGKWGFIDKNNRIAIPTVYDETEPFKNGKAEVKLNGRWLYIDKTGKEVE